MARASTEAQRAHGVYSTLQASSCPVVEDLYLRVDDDDDGVLQLLVTPSRCRTLILTWICSRINPSFGQSKAGPAHDQEALVKEVAALGQELMLCRADDLDLIRGRASPRCQLQFLEQLLVAAGACPRSARRGADGELLLSELFAAGNLALLRQTLRPALDPWPAHAHRRACRGRGSSTEVSDIAALLESARSHLEQLRSKVVQMGGAGSSSQSLPLSPTHTQGVSWRDMAGVGAGFRPDLLRVAAQDLQQLMSTFSHVFESDLRAVCSPQGPAPSTDPHVVLRIHQLLLALGTELEVLTEVCHASQCVTHEVTQLQTHPQAWSRGGRGTLAEQLLETSRRIKDLLLPLQSSCEATSRTTESSESSAHSTHL